MYQSRRRRRQNHPGRRRQRHNRDDLPCSCTADPGPRRQRILRNRMGPQYDAPSTSTSASQNHTTANPRESARGSTPSGSVRPTSQRAARVIAIMAAAAAAGRPRPIAYRTHSPFPPHSRPRAPWGCTAWRLRLGRWPQPPQRSCSASTASESPHLTHPKQSNPRFWSRGRGPRQSNSERAGRRSSTALRARRSGP